MRIFVVGTSGMRVFTRSDLLKIIARSNSASFNEKLQFMERELLNQYVENDQNIAEVKQKLSIIRHQFIDGKVCNAATHTKSTMKCYLCGATSRV